MGRDGRQLKTFCPFLKSMDEEKVGVSGGLESCSCIFYIVT